MTRALQGLRVVEISKGMAGGLAGMVLASHGAEVVRIEAPRPDPYVSEAGSRLWNRGKQRIALDLDDPHQGNEARALASAADVVLVAVRPETAIRWGLAPEALAKSRPELVVATLTGFGWNGPHRDAVASDALVHALSGSMMMAAGNSGYRPGPIFLATPFASYGAAMLTVQGILAALHWRDSSGVGQHVDTSVLDGLLVYRGAGLLSPDLHPEEFPAQPGGGDPRGRRPLFNLAECADGRWLCIAAWTPALAVKALEVLGMTHLLADERFSALPNFFPDEAARAELLNLLWARLREEPAEKWWNELDAQGVPCELVSTVDQFRELGQLWANGQAVTVADPVTGRMTQPGVLGQLSKTPGEVRAAEPAPSPAAAAAPVRARWERAGEGTAAPSNIVAPAPAAPVRGPLAGLRVLDFSVFLSGPTCTRLLADMGAEVTKVESFEGDDWRFSTRNAFMLLHRQKRGVALNLKAPGSEDALAALVRNSDVVVSNYRLGVEERLGLSYEKLRAMNPGIIVCRMTAFGAKGERAHRGGYDASITALSGFGYAQAGEGNSPVNPTLSDISTGIATATAIMIALRARRLTGEGQALDVSMVGSMAYVAADRFVDYAGKPASPVLDQGQHGLSAFHRLYRTSDGWVFLSIATDREWGAFRTLSGIAGDWQGNREGRDGEAEHNGAIASQIAEAFAARPTGAWVEACANVGVTCVDPVREFRASISEDPTLIANGTFIRVPHPYYGRLGQPGAAVRFSRTPSLIARQEPKLGEHTVETLQSLGFEEAEIQAWRASGAILAPA